jgi:hypothetical protein
MLFLPEFCSLFIRFGGEKISEKCPQKFVWSCVGKWCSANGTLFRGVNEMHCILPTCECFPIWVKCCIKKFQRVFSISNCTFLLGASAMTSARLTWIRMTFLKYYGTVCPIFSIVLPMIGGRWRWWLCSLCQQLAGTKKRGVFQTACSYCICRTQADRAPVSQTA